MTPEECRLLDLPALPASWRWRRLGELVDETRGICYGIVQPGKHDAAGVPMINSQDVMDGWVAPRINFRVSRALHGSFKRSTIRGGEVLLTLVGANFGRAATAPESFAGFNCSRTVGVLPVKENPPFVMMCLRSPVTRRLLNAWANTTAQPTFNLKDVANLPIPVPPPDEQRAIVEVLLPLEEKIDLNRRMNETLETMAAALFKSWFMSFDPVRAKMAGRAPTGMDAATASLFSSAFDESELGPIPGGWKTVPLGTLFDLDKGISYKGAFLRIDGHPMVNLGCFLGEGRFAADRVKGYSGDVRERHWVNPGDLVLANTDMTQNRVILGSPAIVPDFPGQKRLLFSHHVFAARFRNASVEAKLFCFYSLLQPEFRNRAAGFATGTTVLALPRDAVLKLEVVLPPLALLRRFGELAVPLRGRVDHNLKESQTLRATRDLLLPKLLSGEVRVRDAEREVGRVA